MTAYEVDLTVWVDADSTADAAEVALGNGVEGARRILSRCDDVRLADEESERYARSASQVLDQALRSAAAQQLAGQVPQQRTRPED